MTSRDNVDFEKRELKGEDRAMDLAQGSNGSEVLREEEDRATLLEVGFAAWEKEMTQADVY
jgi:hypothetical protein